jgi:hypothetical protein
VAIEASSSLKRHLLVPFPGTKTSDVQFGTFAASQVNLLWNFEERHGYSLFLLSTRCVTLAQHAGAVLPKPAESGSGFSTIFDGNAGQLSR